MRTFAVENLYNSFWHSHFCYTDWDMMWSKSETSRLNSVLHAISGAPIYISDPLGISERENIIPFCLESGELLKCDDFAYPTKDRLFVNPIDEKLAMKGFNKINECGIIGVMNVCKSNSSVSDCFKVSDSQISGESFVVFDYYTKNAILSNDEYEHKFELAPYEAKLYTISPIVDDVAIIGDIDKFISPAIVDTRIDNGNIHIFTLKQGGRFAFYTEREFEIQINGKKTEVQKSGIYYIADCSQINNKVCITLIIH